MPKEGLLALCVIGALAVGVPYGLSKVEYSRGSRAGHVIKFSEKGMLFKTYEGQLALEGLATSTGENGNRTLVPNVWDFSLDDTMKQEQLGILSVKVSKAMDSGERVKVTYSQRLFTFPWQSETNYLVQNVELVK